MQYARRELSDELVIIEIDKTALAGRDVLYSDGNAASHSTKFSDDILVVEDSAEALSSEYWHHVEDGKRRRSAELLVFSHISSIDFTRLIVKLDARAQALREVIGLPVDVDSKLFF